MKEKIKNKINLDIPTKYSTYISYFFIFALLGWILETIYGFIVLGHFTKRGFLYGPICPIYGYSALILIVCFYKYKDHPIKLFLYAALVCSFFEYFVSYVLEVLFHAYWWDYTYESLNLNGRICFGFTFAWGFIAILFIKYFYPLFKNKFDKLTSKIPQKIVYSTLSITTIIYLVDTGLSCYRYLIQ